MIEIDIDRIDVSKSVDLSHDPIIKNILKEYNDADWAALARANVCLDKLIKPHDISFTNPSELDSALIMNGNVRPSEHYLKDLVTSSSAVPRTMLPKILHRWGATELLGELVNDPDPQVRVEVAHWDCSPDNHYRKQLLNDDNFVVELTALDSLDPLELDTSLIPSEDLNISEIQNAIRRKEDEATVMLGDTADNYHDVCDRLSKSHNFNDRLILARYGDEPHLQQLAADDNSRVRQVVASRTTDPKLVKRYLVDLNSAIQTAAAGNDNVTFSPQDIEDIKRDFGYLPTSAKEALFENIPTLALEKGVHDTNYSVVEKAYAVLAEKRPDLLEDIDLVGKLEAGTLSPSREVLIQAYAAREVHRQSIISEDIVGGLTEDVLSDLSDNSLTL